MIFMQIYKQSSRLEEHVLCMCNIVFLMMNVRCSKHAEYKRN